MNEKIAAADTPAARLRWARENRSSHKTASERPSVKGNPFDVPDLGSDPMSDDEFDALWKACPNQPGMVRILQRMEGFTPYQVGVVIGYVMRMTEEKR